MLLKLSFKHSQDREESSLIFDRSSSIFLRILKHNMGVQDWSSAGLLQTDQQTRTKVSFSETHSNRVIIGAHDEGFDTRNSKD